MKIQFGKVLIFLVSFLVFISIAELVVAKTAPQITFKSAIAESIDCYCKSDITTFSIKPKCKMNLKVIDQDNDVITTTNSLGYRGEEFEINKKSGEKRILIEGDSFALGWGVEDKSVISNVLEEKLGEDWNVINAGYAGGRGPDGYFLHLKNEGIKLSPDLVIFSLFVYNDFTDIADNEWIGTGKYGEPERIISNKFYIDKKGILMPKDLRFVYKIPVIKNSHLAVLAYKSYEKVKNKVFPEKLESYSSCFFGDKCHRTAMHLYEDIMSTIKASRDVVDSRFSDGKTHFLVMIIPADFQIDSNLKEKYKLDKGVPENASSILDPNPQKRLKEMMDLENIEYLDLLPILRQEKDSLYFPNDGHWNTNGHLRGAEALYNWITNNYGRSTS